MADSTFDKLVSGLSFDDRQSLLERINKNSVPTVQLADNENFYQDKGSNLHIKYEGESFFYKIYLWFRSLLQKRTSEELYNDDVIAGIARKISHEHPGLLNHRTKCLDSLYFERLKALKTAADFFKPYVLNIENDPGDFYVFLSSFVAPEISEQINKEADPFSIPFSKEVSTEQKPELLRKLDGILNNLSNHSKSQLYTAVTSVNWLQHFCALPFLHFMAQFTNVSGSEFTCPYRNARTDYDLFASVFNDVRTFQNETLEAVFLFTAKKGITNNAQDKDVERAVKEFLIKANSNLSLIQMYMTCVPNIRLGKVISENYDWQPDNMPGAEAWFVAFRAQWRKIIEIRWKEWLRERKKSLLADSLSNDFSMNEFPTMEFEPWKNIFIPVNFNYELTGGFLSWFVTEHYGACSGPMNEVVTEGIFIKNENRAEYSEALNNFVHAVKEMENLLDLLSPNGEFGMRFEEINSSKIHSLQNQNSIDSMMRTVENNVRKIAVEFKENIKKILDVYHGFFDDDRDGQHETLQNWLTIKGRDNRLWRDKLGEIRELLKKFLFYIEELEPIDAQTSM
jgi:hypothetical protein